MNLLLILAMFVTTVGGFSLYGLYDWWRPRRDLDKLFAERRAERVAVTRIAPAVLPAVRHLEAVA